MPRSSRSLKTAFGAQKCRGLALLLENGRREGGPADGQVADAVVQGPTVGGGGDGPGGLPGIAEGEKMRSLLWVFAPAVLLAQINVPFDRIRDANKEPGNWLSY